MSMLDRVASAFGLVRGSRVPAMVGEILANDRATREAEQRAFATTAGEAFARGIEDQLRSFGFLRREAAGTYSSHGVVYTCMRRGATNVSAVPFKLWKKQPDGTPGDEVTDHPLLEALQNPNPDLYSDGTQFVEMLVLYLLGSGNAWVLADDVRNSKSRIPVRFTVLGARHVAPEIDPHSWRLKWWTLHFGAIPRPIAVDELDHVKFSNPDSGPQILGLGPLQATRQDVVGDVYRERYDEAFFVHGGAPSMKMKWQGYGPENTRQPLKPEDLKAARLAVEDAHAGVDKMRRVAALNLGWDLEPFGVTHGDMQFVEAHLKSVRAIGRVFSVMSVLLNDPDSGGGLAETQIQAAETFEARQMTVPVCRRLSKFFQRIFVDRYAPGLIGAFDEDEIEPLKVNFDKKVANYERLVRSMVSPKAANDLVDLGLDPAALSDEPLVPFSLTKLSDVLADDPAPVAAAPALPPGTPKTDPDEQPEPTPPGDRKLILIPPSAIRRVVAGRAEAQREQQRTQRWRAFVAGLTPLERRYHRAVRKYVFGLRAETLGNLADAKVAAARMRGIDDDLRKILFDERAADARLRNLSSPFFEEAIRVGSTSAALDLDADPIGIEAPGMAEFLELKEIKVVGINDTIRDALRVTLREGLNEGETLNDLAGRVRQVFDASASRARTIARTEIASAASGARFLEMAAQGVEEIEWLSARDEHVRGSHQAMDGEVVTMGQPFSAGILYPGDVNGPPEEIINCFPAETIVRGDFLGGLCAPYAGPLVELRTRAGHRLRVTPNHPVLTPEGFVPAQSLRKGDHVLSQRGGVEAVMRSGPLGQHGSALPGHHYVDRGPASIRQVLETLRQAGAHLRTKRPMALDLDGDGRFFHGDIEIVQVYGELVCNLQATGTEGRHELGLEASASGEAVLARAGHAMPALAWHALAPRSGVGRQHATSPRSRLGLRGRSRIGEASGGRERDVAPLNFDRRLVQSVRFGRGPEFDSSLYELAADTRPRHAQLDREALHRSAGSVARSEAGQVDRVVRDARPRRVGTQGDARARQVAADRGARSVMLARELTEGHALTIAADEIIEIRKDLPFVGHVYDLQATGGWMLADGIVASNCRCVAQPVNG